MLLIFAATIGPALFDVGCRINKAMVVLLVHEPRKREHNRWNRVAVTYSSDIISNKSLKISHFWVHRAACLVGTF